MKKILKRKEKRLWNIRTSKQQIKKQIEAVVEEGKGFTEKPIHKGLCPETSFTDENPEKLSVMLKNITSKNETHN